MKRYDYFKTRNEIKEREKEKERLRLEKERIRKAFTKKACECLMASLKLSLLIFLFCLSSCVRHDDMEFRGKVIDVRQCDMSYLDQNPGYVVQLEYPDGVGGTISEDGNTAENLVVLYEPDRHIMVGDTITGRFYLDEKYSRSNCSVHWDYDLPEGVFTKVRVEK